MKKRLGKILLILFVIILLVNIIYPVITSADDIKDVVKDEAAAIGKDFISNPVEGIVGILLYPMKLFILMIATGVRTITGGIALLGGANSGATIDTIFIAPEDILFNKVKLVDINFFDFNVSGAVLKIRENIAIWYYGLRNLAVVLLLAILVYVGIRMTLSTVATDEAKYKKMLVDWFVSFALIFVLHYIIIITLNINDGLVEIFEKASANLNATGKYGEAMNQVLASSFYFSITVGMTSAIIYSMLAIITIMFLIMYIKRMITIGFLIMIAPIITITYSIDKMGDGKSQALNTWLKEFVYNVLIQPFHCLIYLSIGGTAVSIMDGTLSSSVLAIVMLLFIFKAESIVRNIFGFDAAKSSTSGMAAAAMVGGALSNMKGGKGGGGGSSQGRGNGALPKSMKNAGKSGGNSGSLGAPGSSETPGSSSTSGGSGNPGGTGGQRGGSARPMPSTPIGKVGGLIAHKYRQAGGMGGLAKKGITKQSRMALKMFGAAAGLTAGAGSGDGKALTGALTGFSAGQFATDKVDQKLLTRRVEKNERYFAGAYNDFAAAHPNMSRDRIAERTKAMLNMSDDQVNNLNDADRRYANHVRAMQSTYQDAGIEKPDDKVLDTLKDIQDGKIYPK